MGWFDEQIRDRKQNDDDAFAEAFSNMASAVMGKRIEASLNDDRTVTKDAIDEILKYYLYFTSSADLLRTAKSLMFINSEV